MRPPGDVVYTMENHSTALQAWAIHHPRDARCVHLDAHLDVGWDSPVSGTSGPARLRERDCFLHTCEGHFDIASWLGVALSAGMVSELFWVVPDEVWFTEPRQLQNLLSHQVGQVPVASFTGLRQQCGRYRFTVLDTDVIVCRLRDLPHLGSSAALLDIDLDFFARYRAPEPHGDWSTPWVEPDHVVAELYDRVPGASVTTLSTSWHGGYLPTAVHQQVSPLQHGAQHVEAGDFWHRPRDRDGGAYAHYTRACGLLHRRRGTEALAPARTAASAAPEVGAYHYALGLALDASGNPEAAAMAMRRCLDSGTIESAQVLNDVAGVAARSERLADALVTQQAAFDIDESKSPIISGNLMALHAQAGQWDQARTMAATTLARQPFNSDALVTLASALQHCGDAAAAADAWLQAADVTLDDRAAAGYRRRGQRLSGRGRRPARR